MKNANSIEKDIFTDALDKRNVESELYWGPPCYRVQFRETLQTFLRENLPNEFHINITVMLRNYPERWLVIDFTIYKTFDNN